MLVIGGVGCSSPTLTRFLSPEDSGCGVNLVNVRSPKDDIFDIPTFLRRQMD